MKWIEVPEFGIKYFKTIKDGDSLDFRPSATTLEFSDSLKAMNEEKVEQNEMIDCVRYIKPIQANNLYSPNNVSFGMQETNAGLTMMRSVKPLMKKISEDVISIETENRNNVDIPFVIRTQNLSLSFRNGETLEFPNIKINYGDKILLSGDSGTGKTTLFKLILGIMKPTHGKVIFADNDGQEILPDMSKIGYIPQEPNLFPGTIEQNITMYNSKLNSKVKTVVEEVGLSKDLSHFKNGLKTQLDLDKLNISGGQRQKIVLARAKIHESNIILIDEGTSAIDQKTTLDILKNLVQSKSTVVFIAHNFTEEMCRLFDKKIEL